MSVDTLFTCDPPRCEEQSSPLPIWKCRDDSCSLDAVLVMAILVQQALSRRCAAFDRPGLPYQSLRQAYMEWSARGEWPSWNQREMEARRDAIRTLFHEVHGVTIDVRSRLEDTLPVLIPTFFTEFRVDLIWRCRAPKCASGDHVRRERFSQNAFRVPGQWQKDSSTQALVTRTVRRRSCQY